MDDLPTATLLYDNGFVYELVPSGECDFKVVSRSPVCPNCREAIYSALKAYKRSLTYRRLISDVNH